MITIPYWEMALRLVIAVVFGGAIGLERESHGRPAGFRTHILVCIGSTLIMIVSAYAFQGFITGRDGGYDPGRIAAQVVSGIGFLGAGTIMREGANVRGLTTAASLWTVAAIGLTIGAGFYFPAFFTTILVVVTLLVLNKFEHVYLSSKHETINITFEDTSGKLAQIFTVFAEKNVNIYNVELTNTEDGIAELEISVEIKPRIDHNKILESLLTIEGVHNAKYG